IRTDVDRFRRLEISALVGHGSCVGRKACRTLPEVFGTELPANAPWAPTFETSTGPAAAAPPRSTPQHSREPAAVTREARSLNASAARRIWTTPLGYPDWTSRAYLPLTRPLLS